ncbi:helix-turn-helix transcriptional regulator [Lachnospiraceae bacterium 46-15]
MHQALTEAVYYILLSLLQPMHGYGIMQNVEKWSGGRMRLAAGTLYGAINTLLEKGWIQALPEEKDSRKKEYVITALGREVLEGEIVRLTELVENGNRILGGGTDEESLSCFCVLSKGNG